MLDAIGTMLAYPLMQRALIVGILVSLCAALLGVSLVLKRYSMIGDGLSHVGFGALAIATAVNAAPLAVAVPVVVAAAFLLLRMSGNSRLHGESAIAIISAASLAIGVMAVSIAGGTNIDIMNYMFGSILVMSGSDVIYSVILSVIVLALYVIFYPRIFAVTFDENFARATGLKAGVYNMLLAALTAVTVVLGMRLMGALLISSLIIFPSLSAMRVFKSFRGVVVCSAVVSVLGFVVGLLISFVYSTPAGASVVCVDLAAFGIFSLVGALRGLRKGRKDEK